MAREGGFETASKTIPGTVRYRNIWLLLILAFGGFFRIYEMTKESLWLNEAQTVQLARLHPTHILAWRDNIPPLHALLLHYWMAVFGDSEFSVRALSALFGLLSLVLIYRIGALLFNDRSGLLASFILALSLFHIHYSQEARCYSLLAFTALLSYYFFIRIIRGEAGLRNLTAYVVSSSLLTYAHVDGWYILAAQNLLVLADWLLALKAHESPRVGFGKWALLQLLIVLLYLPWVPIMLAVSKKMRFDAWREMPTPASLLFTLIRYAGSLAALVFFVLLSILALAKRIGPWTPQSPPTDRTSRAGLLLLLWLAVPILLPYFLSHAEFPVYMTRHTIAASLALYLLAARGLDRLPGKPVFTVALVLAAGLLLQGISQPYETRVKAQWREAMSYVERHAKDGDLVLVVPWFYEPPVNYYLRREEVVRRFYPPIGRTLNPTNLQGFRKIAAHHDRIWFVMHLQRPSNLLPDKLYREDHDSARLAVTTLLETHRLVEKHGEFRTIYLALFIRPKPVP